MRSSDYLSDMLGQVAVATAAALANLQHLDPDMRKRKLSLMACFCASWDLEGIRDAYRACGNEGTKISHRLHLRNRCMGARSGGSTGSSS